MCSLYTYIGRHSRVSKAHGNSPNDEPGYVCVSVSAGNEGAPPSAFEGEFVVEGKTITVDSYSGSIKTGIDPIAPASPAKKGIINNGFRHLNKK